MVFKYFLEFSYNVGYKSYCAFVSSLYAVWRAFNQRPVSTFIAFEYKLAVPCFAHRIAKIKYYSKWFLLTQFLQEKNVHLEQMAHRSCQSLHVIIGSIDWSDIEPLFGDWVNFFVVVSQKIRGNICKDCCQINWFNNFQFRRKIHDLCFCLYLRKFVGNLHSEGFTLVILTAILICFVLTFLDICYQGISL